MHGMTRGQSAPHSSFAQTGRFGRMFTGLPPLTSFVPGPEDLGKPGGTMEGAVQPPGDDSQDNPRIRAGYTFLGQFIDHNLTLDATSIHEQQVDLAAVHNFRTPALELDSVYGQGPGLQPYLYDEDGLRFLLNTGGDHDLQRNADGRALIPDHRNDENLIVSQLHLLFVKFHNRVVDAVLATGTPPASAYEEARRLVRWHYQWNVLHEFLPRIADPAVVDRVLADPPFTFPADAFMPVEFSGAAFRFGHSQTRSGYTLNAAAGGVLFADPANPGPPDLGGFRPVPAGRAVDWRFFFGGDQRPDGSDLAQRSNRIDTRLSPPMLSLPDRVAPAGTPVGAPFRSLATLNLRRGILLGLPSGQALAAALLAPGEGLAEEKVWVPGSGGEGPAPLWYYVLREAEELAGGQHLAGVGAEIVARSFLAFLLADPCSVLSQAPGWTPTLGSEPGRFTMVDLVNFTLGSAIAQEEPIPGGMVSAPRRVVEGMRVFG